MALRGCCCCGLRGGTLAIGIFFLVLTLLELLGVIAAWALVEVTQPSDVANVGVDKPDGRFGVRIRESHPLLGESGGDVRLDLGSYGTASISSSGDFSLQDTNQHISTLISEPRSTTLPRETCLIPSTVLVLLSLLFNSMLIHGANNGSSCAVLAWLVYQGMMFVIITLGSLGMLIACFVLINPEASDDQHTMSVALGVVGGVYLLVSALLWFWWAVVLAFYRELSVGTAGYKYHREVMLQEAPAVPLPTTGKAAAQPPLPTYAEAAAVETAAEAYREKSRENMRQKWEHL